MIYYDACEAQGMTLADLVKKQDEDKDIIPVGATVNWTELSPDNVLRAQGRTGQGVFARICNNTDSSVKYYVYLGSAEIGSVIMSPGEAFRISSGYPGCTVKNSTNETVIEVIEEVRHTLYSQFGLSKVVLPASADTYLPAIWDRVCTRVNERYWKRYLACETLEEWQVLLQTMTDELAPRYERAFRMYAANSEASEADILATMRTDYGTDGLTDEHTQTAKGTSKTTVRDTPDGVINDTSNYAGTVTEGSTDAGTTKSTRKGTVTVTQTGSDGVLGRVNENIRLWRDLETDLVKEYANAFMSFIWA